MKPLLIESAFPTLHNDVTIAVAQIESTGQMPSTEGLDAPLVLDMTMSYVLFLVKDQRTTAAMQAIEFLLYADDKLSTALHPIVYFKEDKDHIWDKIATDRETYGDLQIESLTHAE